MERNPDDLRPGGEGADPSPDDPLEGPGEGAPAAPPDEATEPDPAGGDDEASVEPALAPDDDGVDVAPEPVGDESPDASAPAGPGQAELESNLAGEPEPQPAPVEPSAVPEPTVPEPEPEPDPEPALGVVSLDGEGAAEALAPAPEEGIAPTSFDPMRGPGEWYVVHTYAGYENKVKANLESRIQSMQMQDKIFDVHIPMEDVMEIKGGKKQVVQKKVFPGYLLVKMVYDNDSWYVVRNTPGVTGFVSSGTGTKPTPLSRREVEKILQVKKEEVKPTFRLEFEEGDMVRIISGPFADFNGHISEINVDQSKLKVLVNIFDRETPVELGFDQVAKV